MTFLQDLRFGVRVLLRAPGFTTLVLAILALGVGANSAVFSIVNAVLLKPLPFADPSSLYQLDEVSPRGAASGVPASDLQAFLDHSGAFSAGALSHWHNATITGPEGAENVYGALVAPAMLPMLGVKPALGRLFRPDEYNSGASPAVLLTDRLWKRRFGRNPDILGRQLMLNGQAHVIAGVLPADFFLSQRYEYYAPWRMTAAELSNRDERAPCLVRLKAGVTPVLARAALEGVFSNSAPSDLRNGWTIRLTPVHDQVTSRSRPALLVILGAVAFVLLIACFNIASLLIARGAGRSREIAIRTALGAGRARVLRQLLTESALLALLGGVAGSLIGAVSTTALVRSYPDRFGIPRLDQAQMDWAVLAFTLGLSIITGLAFGLFPALQALRIDTQESLKQGSRGSSRQSGWARHALVIAETALSIILLVGAGLMLRSFLRLTSVDPGFKPEHVVTVRVPLPAEITERRRQHVHYSRLLDRIAATPAFNSVGIVAPLPLAGVDARASLTVEGRAVPAGERQIVKLRSVSSGYFRALGVTLRRGRVFDETDVDTAKQVAVISESLARRYFPNEDPIGRRVTIAAPEKGIWLEIIGVVNDVKALNLADKPEPELYRDFRQYPFAPFTTTVVARFQSEDTARAAAALERAIRSANPDQPVADLLDMPSILANNVAQPRFYTLLLGAFAAIALALAAVGLYGVLSCSVNQRTKEIGIRRALGATNWTIIQGTMGQALTLVATGAAIGLAGAIALTRLLQTQLYEIQSLDVPTYVAVTGLLLTVAAVAAWAPTPRALSLDPNRALRAD